MNNSNYPQVRRSGLVVQERPDEVLVYDLNTNKAHCLNESAAVVFHACDGTNSVWGGSIIFVDLNAEGTRDATEPVIKSSRFDAQLVVTSSANIAAVNERISFRADGTARGADNLTLLTGILAVCMATTNPAENVRDLSLAFGSRTAVRRRNGGGACGTPNDT